MEWMEFHQIVGVTEFNVYNGDLQPNLHDVFDYYTTKGILHIRPMPPPVDEKTVAAVKLSSPASLNDCMLTNMYRYRFIVVIDFDEFLVPRNHSGLSDLIAHINSQEGLTQDWYSYTFRNAFFFNHFEQDTKQPEFLRTLRFRNRAPPSPYLYAPKSIVDPRRCFSVFNHYCWLRFPDTPGPKFHS